MWYVTFCFFQQKTAYELRIRDWSSDVCSSDLGATVGQVALERADPDLIRDIIARRQITSFCAPPTLYRQLVLADFAAHDLSGLRHCTSAGEPLNPEVIRAWREGTGGLTIYDGYGQSESTLLVGTFPAMPVCPGSMGKDRKSVG